MANTQGPSDFQERKDVEIYRQQRVNEFKLNIGGNPAQEISSSSDDVAPQTQDFSDEITSFSDETTKAQIERASKKELRRQKREEKRIQKVKSGRNKKVYRFTWLVFLIVVSVIAGQFLIDGSRDFLAMNRKDEGMVTIVISKDDNIKTIAEKLKQEGVIDSSLYFRMFATVTGMDEKLSPGIYDVPKNFDYLGIVNRLQSKAVTVTLQITEGQSVREIAQQLYDKHVFTEENRDRFLELCNSSDFDEDYSFVKAIPANADRVYKLEGYLFPDTYEFYYDESPDVTIRRFLDNFRQKIYYDKEYLLNGEPAAISDAINSIGYDLDDFVTIASLIQAEAADADDMGMVSSVIHNRLSAGSQHNIHSLDLDSTEFYPFSSAEEAPEGYEFKYGTYNSKGLPPGAICSAGLEAFYRAIVPTETEVKYFYFCHGINDDGTVTAYYAEDFEEHQKNLVKAGLADE